MTKIYGTAHSGYPQLLGFILVMAGFSACVYVPRSDGARGATDIADTFFHSTVQAMPPETERALGMSNAHVFGRARFLGHDFVGAPTIRGTSESEATLHITMPFWVNGKGADGQGVSVRRDLVLSIAKTDDNKWQVQRHEFSPDLSDSFVPFMENAAHRIGC